MCATKHDSLCTVEKVDGGLGRASPGQSREDERRPAIKTPQEGSWGKRRQIKDPGVGGGDRTSSRPGVWELLGTPVELRLKRMLMSQPPQPCGPRSGGLERQLNGSEFQNACVEHLYPSLPKVIISPRDLTGSASTFSDKTAPMQKRRPAQV